MEPRFFDTHCHLDLMLSPDATANESAALGLGLFDCGIDPCDFEAAKKRASRYPNIIAAVGEPPGMEADARDNVWVAAGTLFCCREVAWVDPAIKDPQSYSRSFVGNSIRVCHQIKMAVCIK